MDRRHNNGIVLQSLKAVVVAAGLGCSVLAMAQAPAATGKPVPDAQVEANVLKALASASDLANQPLTTTTVYGVVTLSGTVQTEALRTEAETLTSRASGVQKVVDEMTLSSETSNATSSANTAANAAQAADPQAGGVLQSDGTMAPAAQAQGSPDSDTTQAADGSPNQANGPGYGPGAPEYRQPYAGQHAPSPDVYAQQNGYPQQQQQQQNDSQQQGYPQQQQQQGNPQQQGYPQQRPGYSSRQGGPQSYGGQPGGEVVTVPVGALVRIRINQPLDSSRTQPGTRFDGIVVNDVVADGSVAIPRGAAVQGTVVDAKKSGALKGRGELSLQLTQVTLAGKSYPLVSNVWNQHGGDKTTETVNKTILGGGIGALFGAVAGGGEGAAIGAGVGGALGLGSAAASHNGQVYVPSEGMLSFQLAQPATVATVSQQEMDRLGQGVPPGAQGAALRRREYRYGPGYAPYPYRPYPYPY
jgi:hypothetical protein